MYTSTATNSQKQSAFPYRESSPFRAASNNKIGSDFAQSPRFAQTAPNQIMNNFLYQRNTQVSPGPRQGMHQIFLDAKEKIRQLKEESRIVMRSPKPLMIDHLQKRPLNYPMLSNSLTRNYQAPQPPMSSGLSSFRSEKPRQFSQTISRALPRPPTYKSPRDEFFPSQRSVNNQPPANKYFDKTEYERQVSNRRREKITSLKAQLIGMLQNQAVSKSEMLHHQQSSMQQTPQKRLLCETTVKQQLSSDQKGMTDSNEKRQSAARHSALKSRHVQKQPLSRGEGRREHQFQLINAFQTQPGTPARINDMNDNPVVLQTGGTIRSICHNTESKLSMYSYSESEIVQTPSPIQHMPIQINPSQQENLHQSRAGLQHKMENLMDNEQSITFISSKFIKSNSVESIPDLQGAPRHLRQLSNREDTSEFALSTNAGGGYGVGMFSDTNPSQGPIHCKRRNQRQGSLAEPSFQSSDYVQSNQTLSRSRERNALGSPRQTPVTEIVKKDDLQRLQVAIKQLQSDDQIKQVPVLYINELRRLAKVINRVFGDGLF